MMFKSTSTATHSAIVDFLKRGGSVTVADAHAAHGVRSEKKAHQIRVRSGYRPANTNVTVLKVRISSLYR